MSFGYRVVSLDKTAQILIIDDDRRMCDSLKAMLQPANYVITTAYSGQKALCIVDQIQFNLILMDYVLPDIPGPQLLNQIRERAPDSALIVMTGHASVDKAVIALRQGAYDFLQKPFEFDELKEKVNAAINASPLGWASPSDAEDTSEKPEMIDDGFGVSVDDSSQASTVGSLVQKAYSVPPHLPVIKVKEFLQAGNPIYSVIVVENKKPIGLVMNIHLDRMLSHRFGFSLYRDKPIHKLMDPEPLIIDAEQSIEEASNLAMSRNMERLYDHLIVTRDGHLIGAVSVRRILQRLSGLLKIKAAKLERAYQNLQRAHNQIKTLGGLIPICAHCKKIRDDRGYWNQLEAYIMRHSEAKFSHGICPECMEKHYSEINIPSEAI